MNKFNKGSRVSHRDNANKASQTRKAKNSYYRRMSAWLRHSQQYCEQIRHHPSTLSFPCYLFPASHASSSSASSCTDQNIFTSFGEFHVSACSSVCRHALVDARRRHNVNTTLPPEAKGLIRLTTDRHATAQLIDSTWIHSSSWAW